MNNNHKVFACWCITIIFLFSIGAYLAVSGLGEWAWFPMIVACLIDETKAYK